MIPNFYHVIKNDIFTNITTILDMKCPKYPYKLGLRPYFYHEDYKPTISMDAWTDCYCNYFVACILLIGFPSSEVMMISLLLCDTVFHTLPILLDWFLVLCILAQDVYLLSNLSYFSKQFYLQIFQLRTKIKLN